MLPPSNLEESLRQGIRGKNKKDSDRDKNKTPEDNKPYVSHAHQNFLQLLNAQEYQLRCIVLFIFLNLLTRQQNASLLLSVVKLH